jgi:peptide/nickel transport system substrate-binding protein
MRTIRLFLYGIPVLLVLLLVASFINASFLSVSKKNEMSIGTSGEPSTLNPIQQADAAAEQVGSLIFNGLLKYDQNLNIVGDLATDWKLSQETTFQFATEEEIAKALSFLATPSTENPIRQSLARGKELVLTLDQPGLTESENLLNTLTGAGFHPLPFPPLEKGGKERPFLAEPIIHFTLRQGVRWHDGAPFTSADVAFTYHAIVDDRVASPERSNFDLVSSVTTPTPYEVIVRYKKPFSPALLSWVKAPPSQGGGGEMLPSHLLEKVEPAKWADYYNRHPVGTGPFKFDAWKTNEYIRLVRNPDYFLGSPWLDSIVFRVLPDPLTLQLAFQTHQVDFWGVSPWAVKSFEKDPRFDLLSSSGSGYSYIGWNLRRPLFQDLRVRKALAQAVNIPQMIKYILYGRGSQSTGPFTPKMWFFNPKVTPLTYDPAAACALLDAAGWKPGPDGIRVKDGKRLSFSLLSANSNDEGSDIATLVQADLKKVGVEMKVEIYEWSVLLKRFVIKGEFDAIIMGWVLDNSYDQFAIWHSSQIHPEELNFIHYNNPKVDRLLSDIRQEYSRPEILRMAGELQQTIYEDQPYLFLFVPEAPRSCGKEVTASANRARNRANGSTHRLHMTKAGWDYRHGCGFTARNIHREPNEG